MLSKNDLELRAKLWNDVTDAIRTFFRSRGYTEVATPVLVKSPGMEPNLFPLGVDVHPEGHGEQRLRMGLITSPEYSMKKLLGGGLEKIFTLTPVFRDREVPGHRWSIEFTMLEWYRQGADYTACMQDTEELVNSILGLTGEWPRLSYVDELAAWTGETSDDTFNHFILPELIKRHDRFFITQFPVAEASLARKSADGRYAERFEAYVNGIEICNAFTELVDVNEQRTRFGIEGDERRVAGKEVFPIDEDLLSRLASVASPTYGNALGVDRLVMLKASTTDIDAIHLFPPSERY